MAIFSAGSASVNIVPDFSGAQRAIARWAEGRDVTVQVHPDLDRREMARADAEIERPRKMHVHIDVDKKQLVEAADFLTGFSTIGKALKGLFSPKTLGLTDAVGAAASLGAALSQAAGAALLLPAGIAALAAPIATITVGVQGMGDAFKALASGDINKINAAMANLAPSARNFVSQMHALGPAFKDLRLDVQQTLFEGLGTTISNLARKELPVLHMGLGDIAFELNDMAKKFADVLGTKANLGQTGDILVNIANTMIGLDNAVIPLTQAFLTITRVGSSFLPGMADAFARMSASFAVWVQHAAATGQLAQIIQTALTRIKELFALVFSAGQLIFTVLKPAVDAGADLLGILTSLFKGLTLILNTPVAQSALTTFFTSIAGAVQTILPSVERLVEALVVDFLPIAGRLIQALAPLIGTILVQFADMLDKIAPIIYPTLVNAITAWLSAIAPLIPIFTEIAQAILPVLAKVLGELAPVISKVADSFGAFLAQALKALAPLLMQIGDAFIQIIKAMLPILPALFTLIQTLLPVLIQLFQAVIPVIVQVVKAIAPLIVQIVQFLTPILKILAQIVVWVFRDVIGPIVTYVVGKIIVPFMQDLMQAFRDLGQVVMWVWNNVIKPAWDDIKATFLFLWHNILEPGIHVLQSVWNWFGTEIGRIYHSFIEPIWKFFSDAIETVKHGFQVAVQGISDIWHGLIHALEYPVQLAIDFVWNNTLRKAWNLLNNLWGGKDLDPVILPGMDAADGAILPGYTPGKDVHHFVSPTGGRLNLSGGEAIMVPEFTRMVGTETIMEWNRKAREGRSFAGGGVWPAADFGSNVDIGDRSLSWAQKFGLDIIPFLPGGQLLAPLADYVRAEASGSKNQGGTPIFGMIGATIRNGLNNLWEVAKNFVTQTLSPGGGTYANYQADKAARAAAAAASVASNPIITSQTGLAAIQAAHLVASTYGWGSGAEWDALNHIINSESGWNPNAQNPTSTAYGLFQFLNSTWAGFPYGKTSDPYKQSVDGMEYIRRRYIDPIGAWNFHLAHGWYDRGGFMPPGWSLNYNGTGRPEVVLNAAQADRVTYMLSGASGGARGPTIIAGIHGSNIYVTDLAELSRVQRQAARRTMVAQAVRV